MAEAANESASRSSVAHARDEPLKETGVLFPRRRDALLGGSAIFAGALLAGAVGTSGSRILCPFRLATGLDCPFCGGTRATHVFLNGDIARAFDHNVLVAALVPVVLLIGLLLLWRGVIGRSWRIPMPSHSVWIALGTVALIFWVLRNLPMFSWLGSS